MCGLAGAFSWKDTAPLPSAEDVVAARDTMWRRGQDDKGLWSSADRRMVLGHRRLAIIDLDPRSAQPFRRGNLQIVFNGEIYNFRELRSELENEGEQFATEGDAEVILALYARFGAACVERLRGMFAFVIADEGQRTMFLARDHYGIKPLYYADCDGSFYFASQVKALRKISAISAEPDPAGIVGFHLTGSVPEPFTIYRSIRCLEAGRHLTVTTAGVGEPIRFANIAAVLASAARDDSSSLEETVASAMRDTVRAHLVADVEVGLLLSAGIDSGALLGLMRDCGANRVRAVTMEFAELRGTSRDEAPLAREIARRAGAQHQVDLIEEGEFGRCAEAIFQDMDQPTIDGINSWFACRLASRAGLKVALSGLGADEILGGYGTFQTIPRVHRIARRIGRTPLAGRLAKWALRNFGPTVVRGNPKIGGVLDYAETLPGAYVLMRAVLLSSELDGFLDEATVSEGLSRLRLLDRVTASVEPEPQSDIARLIALESSNYMRNQLLRDADWASMAHTLELRVPFVDWPTLRAIAPVAHRLGDRAGKLALARAPSQPLPAEVTERPKTGFSIPIASWVADAKPVDRLASRKLLPTISRQFAIA